MQRLACLDHLTGSSRYRLAMNEALPLSLQPLCEFSWAEQLNLLAAVGQGSLDSRPLRDVLSVKELLNGFYQQAGFIRYAQQRLFAWKGSGERRSLPN